MFGIEHRRGAVGRPNVQVGRRGGAGWRAGVRACVRALMSWPSCVPVGCRSTSLPVCPCTHRDWWRTRTVRRSPPCVRCSCGARRTREGRAGVHAWLRLPVAGRCQHTCAPTQRPVPSSHYIALLSARTRDGRWAYYLPLAQLHLNITPTAALGGRSPYWARFGTNPNVTAIPPLEPLLELLDFPRWGGWVRAARAGWR